MRFLLTFLFCLLAVCSNAATVTGNLTDSFGNAYGATSIQYTPQSYYQASGATTTVIPSTVVQQVVNGQLVGTNFAPVNAFYTIKVLPQNLNVPIVTGFVPADSGSYTFNQVLAMSTNLMQIVSTNPLTFYQPGNNVYFITNGQWITISSIGGGGAATNVLFGTTPTINWTYSNGTNFAYVFQNVGQ